MEKLESLFAIFEATAVPQTVDLQYLYSTSGLQLSYIENTNEAREIMTDMLQQISSDQMAQQQLLIQYLNYGNYYEIESELRRQGNDKGGDGLKFWQQIANTIIAVKQNEMFKLYRLKITHYHSSKQMQEQGFTPQNLIEKALQEVVKYMPDGLKCSTADLFYHAIASKVYDSTTDIFIQSFPQFVDQMSEAEMALINQATRQFGTLLRQNMAKIQVDSLPQTSIDNLTILLETKVAASRSPQTQLSNLIYLSNDDQLIGNITSSIIYFVNGIIPGTITPAKILGNNDIKSEGVIRSSIVHLASTQIREITQDIPNENVASRMQELAIRNLGMGEIYSAPMQTSLNQSKFIERDKVKMGSMIQDLETSQIINQAQGPYSLSTQLTGMRNRNAKIITLGDEQSEQLKFFISIALACVRMRFDAIQQTDFEFVQQGDIQVLYMCEKLSNHIVDPYAMTRIKELSQILVEMMLAFNDDRTVKITTNIKLDELHKQKAIAEEQIGQVIMQIRLFSDDAQSRQGELYKQLIHSMYSSLTLQNREEQEIEQRRRRRQLFNNAINSITV